MADYSIEEKLSFTVKGVGVKLSSSYTDQKGITREKEVFYHGIASDGTLEKLKSTSLNDYLFAVNGAVEDDMMFFLGVETEQELPEMIHKVDFPAGKYLVIPGDGETEMGLSNRLTEMAFGDVLNHEEEYIYEGGPNAAVIRQDGDGGFHGEMWIPVVRQEKK